MRILVDIPDRDLQLLTSMSKAERVSRAELIRRAVNAYLAPRQQKWAGVDAAFGLWADKKEDGLAYQERLRKEWDRDENGL